MAKWPYNTARWARLREQVLRSSPVCVMCRAIGVVKAANAVDHITPISQGGAPFGRDNLQALCAECHNRHKQRQDKGGVIGGCDQHGMPIDPNHPWSASHG